MKTITVMIGLCMLILTTPLHAQFGNLGKKLEKKVNDRINRKVDKTMDKGLDEVEKGVDDAVSGDDAAEENAPEVQEQKTRPAHNPATGATGGAAEEAVMDSAPGEFLVNTKFDYVPGDKIMVFEDFSEDAIGDFPAKWNTDGTGEIVTFDDASEKWLMMKSSSMYIPDLPYTLPDEYTIEFDLFGRGIDKGTSSVANLTISFSDNKQLQAHEKDYVHLELPFGQYGAFGIQVSNNVSEDSDARIFNTIATDIREEIMKGPHISIAVNKQRVRLWVNDEKQVDVPRLMPNYAKLGYLKFMPYGFKDGKEDVFIRNLKIAEGGLDLRSQLLKDGKVSTNGILFDAGSDRLKPESYGVIRQIALALQEQPALNLRVIGHTDSDGDEAVNLKLSQSRAAAVRQALIDDYGIAQERLQTDGKGEASPIGDNTTLAGKANNRRVEFVKI